ncbi:Miniconductance mechanosensitive channel [Serratia odorifera]|uniref:Miniconductance mechanosensitive channel n=1 Tax=Serratia odorifera TaxID=618 RepID=A0A3S4DEA9_SEROD|nr:Miniconductance mechanosensitive channel [Serratia odorifera]
MQQRIAQWLGKFGIEFTDVMSLVMVLGLIVLISVVIHLVLHRVVLAAIQRRGQQSQRVWQQALTQHKLFQRAALLLQGVIINLQAILWLHNGSQTQAFIVTAAQVWILAFVLLTLFRCSIPCWRCCARAQSPINCRCAGFSKGSNWLRLS